MRNRPKTKEINNNWKHESIIIFRVITAAFLFFQIFIKCTLIKGLNINFSK